MPQQVILTGGEQLAIVAKRLRDAGAKDLRRELVKALNRSTKPLRQAAKQNARDILPHRGGLGKRVARTRMTTRTRLGAANVSVDIQAKPGAVADPKRIDRGRVAHPVYGRRPMVFQDVPKGWFTQAMKDGEPTVHRELQRAIREVAVKAGRRL